MDYSKTHLHGIFYYTCVYLRLHKSFTVFRLTLFYIAKYFISASTFFHIFTAPSYVLMYSIVNVFICDYSYSTFKLTYPISLRALYCSSVISFSTPSTNIVYLVFLEALLLAYLFFVFDWLVVPTRFLLMRFFIFFE